MALKPFNELIKIDVRPQCDTRDAKDENGKAIKVPYLNWGKCAKLLHENGANDVWYAPVECPTTHTYLWPQAKVSTNKGRDTECWFVRVLIHIDELEFTYVKERNGLDHNDLRRGIGIGDRELNKLMGYFSTIDKFEKAVSRL